MPRNELSRQLKRRRIAHRSLDVPSTDEGREKFWKTKTLEEMTAEEWESLCDGCAQCCLIKLEDEDSGDIAITRLACELLDLGSCRCSDYANRHSRVADCIKLTPHELGGLSWLPESCAYRLVREGRDLFWWHPLVSGSTETVHEAGISIRGAAISEKKVPEERFPAHIVGWIKPQS